MAYDLKSLEAAPGAVASGSDSSAWHLAIAPPSVRIVTTVQTAAIISTTAVLVAVVILAAVAVVEDRKQKNQSLPADADWPIARTLAVTGSSCTLVQ